MSLVISKLPGNTGKEGCLACGFAWGRTKHYGHEIVLDDVYGFSGWRGPFCSAKCYRTMYPDEQCSA